MIRQNEGLLDHAVALQHVGSTGRQFHGALPDFSGWVCLFAEMGSKACVAFEGLSVRAGAEETTEVPPYSFSKPTTGAITRTTAVKYFI